VVGDWKETGRGSGKKYGDWETCDGDIAASVTYQRLGFEELCIVLMFQLSMGYEIFDFFPP
jgi:hypothetical protein